MDELLWKELYGVLSKLEATLIYRHEALGDIHAIYLKHGYGQPDEEARLPPLLQLQGPHKAWAEMNLERRLKKAGYHIDIKEGQ